MLRWMWSMQCCNMIGGNRILTFEDKGIIFKKEYQCYSLKKEWGEDGEKEH